MDKFVQSLMILMFRGLAIVRPASHQIVLYDFNFTLNINLIGYDKALSGVTTALHRVF